MRRLRNPVYILTAFVALVGTFANAQEGKYALKGTLVTPDEVLENGALLVAGEKIEAMGTNNVIPSGTKAVETGGIIIPGFIDLHNHLTWNVLPRWKPNKEFGNRYDWQQIPAYGIALATPHAGLGKENLGCELNRYAEVKSIVEGGTSSVGSLFPPKTCIEGLVRNLDFYSGFYRPGVLDSEKLRYEVFPLELDSATVSHINEALDKRDLTAFVVHLAEGKPTDASAAREFRMFVARGFLRPGVSIVHGVALRQADFRQMATNKVGLIWSPHSNMELYGATTDVASALREKVKIALAPDWSPTGSNGMLEELKYAAIWNGGQYPPVFTNLELVRMATEYAAQLAGLEDKIGRLSTGYYADLLVLRRTRKDAYEAVVHASPADVDLVTVSGQPIYGNPDLMKKLLPNRKLEPLTVCGTRKAIDLQSDASLTGQVPKTWAQMTEELNAALREWGSYLAALTDCVN